MPKYCIEGVLAKKITKSNTGYKGYINLLGGDGKLRFDIKTIISSLKKLQVYPTEISLDLLLLAILVYSADKCINRLQAAEDGWTREIEIKIPVSDVKKWDNNKNHIKHMLDFLTGDIWTLTFIKRPAEYKQLLGHKAGSLFSTDTISLFSGGLDSLIGMIDLIESGKEPLFISFGGGGSGGKTQSSQEAILKAISEYELYKNINRVSMNFYVENIFPNLPCEDSTRSRSFLFFAIGALAGSGLATQFKFLVPENGFIALNIPLEITRIGSFTTRTTHPYYMFMWNELLSSLGIDGKIENPYWDKTKGEMIKESRNINLLKKMIKLSVSCSHPSTVRWEKSHIPHCGGCFPCLIRRAAIMSALGVDNTGYRLRLKRKKILTKHKSGETIRSIQYAIERLKKNHGIENSLILSQGPLTQDFDKIKDYASIYKRGLEEIGKLLKGVKTFVK